MYSVIILTNIGRMIILDVITPTKARKDFFKLLQEVADSHKPVLVHGKNDIVMVAKEDWDAIQETLHLYQNGQAQDVLERKNSEDFVSAEEIDWDTI